MGREGGARVLGSSSTQRLKINLNLLATAQHPHGRIETAWGNRHLSAAHQLPVPGEEHLHDQGGGRVGSAGRFE